MEKSEPMHIHFFQHVPFEGPASIEDYFKKKGATLSFTNFFDKKTGADLSLPAIESIDMLVVMGGPMSVNDEDQLPWLINEKHFIKSMIEADKPILGICLGAQLIAAAMGAKVYRNSVKEIGWFPVNGISIEDSDRSIFRFPPQIEVFHWHGETFDLPEGSVRLAESIGCRNQAFQIGESVIALQFHLETTPESAQSIVANCREELIPSTYIQSEEEILSAEPSKYQAINSLMHQVIDFLTCNR